MNKAILYSVPGTGTRFCKKFLENVLGYRQVTLLELTTDEPRIFYQQHSSIINFDSKIMPLDPSMTLVTPLRDPYLSYITRSSLSGKNAQQTLEYIPRSEQDWKNLIEMTSRYSSVFLPIDCNESDRVSILQSVACHLSAKIQDELLIEYANEWPILKSRGTNEAKKEYLEHGTIDGEVPHFLDFAVEWCGNKQEEQALTMRNKAAIIVDNYTGKEDEKRT